MRHQRPAYGVIVGRNERMEVAVADIALESFPDTPPLGANGVEPRFERGIVGSVQRTTC
jgi:hypothetical protein